jgi:hypothetical protein
MTQAANVFRAIISHARPANVAAMLSIAGPGATWYVGSGEAQAYRNAGASQVIEAGGLCESRNRALKDAWSRGQPCLQLSDDLKRIKLAQPGVKPVAITLDQALDRMLGALSLTHARLAGVAPTANAFYYQPKKPISTRAFCVGDMILVLPCELLFDPACALKEDYDYSMQHLKAFGVVARCDMILAEFKHRGNPGGAVEWRTSERMKTAIARLRQKWGAGAFPDNPKRQNEILMRPS